MPCRGYSTWEYLRNPRGLGGSAKQPVRTQHQESWTASKLSRPSLAYSGLPWPTLACFGLLSPFRCLKLCHVRKVTVVSVSQAYPSLSVRVWWSEVLTPQNRYRAHPAIPSQSNQKQVTQSVASRKTNDPQRLSRLLLTLLTNLAHPSSLHDEAFSLLAWSPFLRPTRLFMIKPDNYRRSTLHVHFTPLPLIGHTVRIAAVHLSDCRLHMHQLF